MSEAPVVVDISAMQSAESRGRGIARYALSWCIALEQSRPDLVYAYVLKPQLPPPGDLRELTESGKVTQSTPTLLARATIFHQLAPFDLSQSAATLLPVRARGQLTSATVYDLIPALDQAMLTDPPDRRRYRTRMELVRSLHHIQVLSEGVAGHLHDILGIDSSRITNVGAAPDAAFVPPLDRNQATATATATLGRNGLRREYVLYPSGSHPRKNNELLIKAWALISSELRDHFQLVITGAFDDSTIHHFEHLATGLGIGESLVIPGFVTDEEIVALTQGATLVCFASLAEGFGLPIVEALACMTPVIASAISPHDELLGHEDLFDATSASAIAEALSHALSKLSSAPTTKDPRTQMSWNDVAKRSATAFDKMLAEQQSRPMPRPLRRSRPKIAVVSPLPPAPSGIARYSYRFIEEMAATEKVEVVCFSDGPTSDQEAPESLECYSVRALQHVEHLTGHFDEIVYVMGNSHHHLGALAMLQRRRGLVMSHDVRLSNLYRHAHGEPGYLPGGLGREIGRMYNYQLPATLGAGGELSDEDLERFGLLMARDIISLSTGFLVTSMSARHLASLDARPQSIRRIATLPFAMEAPRVTSLDFAETGVARPPALVEASLDLWGRPPSEDRYTYLAHFGIVDPIKDPDLLVDTLGLLTDREDLRLVFVGPISEELCAELVLRARGIGVEGRLGFTGPLAPDTYLTWLNRATLALQLRNKSNGEASAAIGECLATGLATVVSEIGWSGELPRDCVHHVRFNVTSRELALEISVLLDDTRLRHAIGDAGAIHAKRHSFDYAARALLALIADRTRARQRTGADA